MSSALLLIDFINENVSFEGKMAKKAIRTIVRRTIP